MNASFLKFGESKKNIVFIHGWGQNKRSFLKLIPFFYPHFSVFLLDLPGFGKSTKIMGLKNSFDYARWTVNWMKENNLKEVNLVGHSWGGKIAAIISSLHPEIIKKLILIDSSGISTINSTTILTKITPNIIKKIFKPIATKYFVSKDYKEAGENLSLFKEVVKEDIRSEFSNIKSPTLVIWGDNDTETPLYQGKIINNLIKSSQIRVFRGGHFPFLDNPKAVGPAIKAFINL